MLNATQTNNYSLVIPHLLPSDTGTYSCSSQLERFNNANIFVCSILDPINITFALGDSADLMCVFNLSYFPRVQWYKEYNQSSEYLLVDRVKEDMKKRLNASDPNHITISELSLQDGGSYWCRVWVFQSQSSLNIHDTSTGHFLFCVCISDEPNVAGDDLCSGFCHDSKQEQTHTGTL